MSENRENHDSTNGAPKTMRVGSGRPARSHRLNPHHVADWFKSEFAGDRLASFFKTLLWAAPLTLLIWIYAERQQQVRIPQVTIPIEVESSDPGNWYAYIQKPRDGNVVVTVRGPKGAVDRIGQLVNPLQGNPPVKLRVERSGSGGMQLIPTVRVGQDRRFVDAGITIESPQPDSIEVWIEPYEERDIPVRVKNPDQSRKATFDPPTVRVRAPQSMFREPAGGLVAYVEIPAADPASAESETIVRDLKVTLPLSDTKHVTVTPATVTAKLQPSGVEEFTIPVVLVRVAATDQVLRDYDIAPIEPIHSVTVSGPREDIDKLRNAPAPRAFVELRPNVMPGENDADVRYDFIKAPVTLKEGGGPSTVKVNLTPRR